jgi:DNA-binding SARP family transcriptional activator
VSLGPVGSIPTLGECSNEEEAPGRLRLSLLGGFRLTCDAGEVELSLVAQRLLAFLALRPGFFPRRVAAEALWPTLPVDRARANLRSTLWKLPDVPCAIETAGNEIALSAAVSVDVINAIELFRRLLAQSGSTCSRPAAGHLWGELLPDWYDEWVILERERLRQLRLAAQEMVCRTMARAGRHYQAVEAGLACVREEPLRESAHRALIEAHIAEGNWCEAMRQYERYRRVLSDELGVSPSRGLATLLERARTPPLHETGAAGSGSVPLRAAR